MGERAMAFFITAEGCATDLLSRIGGSF